MQLASGYHRVKELDGFNLIDKIGCELQSRMTYANIDIYLKGFDVNVRMPVLDANNRRIHPMECLAGQADSAVPGSSTNLN